MNHSKKITVLIIFLAGFLFGISVLTVNKLFFSHNLLYAETNTANTDKPSDPEDDNYFKYYPMFQEAYKVIKREYFDDKKVTAKNMMYGAIKGMLENLDDPYSTFMDPSISKEFSIDMKGSFGGLGIQIDVRDGWITVISPIEDTPAWKAGMKPGDKIIEIEGNTTKGYSVKQAVDKLRGKPGTKVTITVAREGIKEAFHLTLKREEIKLVTVKSSIIEANGKNYAYIKVLEFSMPTAEDFRNQLQKLLDKQPDGLIVDLRNDPGGLLQVVINMVNYFQNEGLIVYTKGKLPENNNESYANKENAFVPLDLPMVVMINQGSASASEIFAGAMQDTGRAVLVGVKSFGKGSVQKTYPFPSDGSQIKYTVARYYTPSGVSIDRIGLTPNVEEKMWLDLISDNEKNSLVKIQNTNFIKDFLTKTPNPNEENIKEFQKSLQKQGFEAGVKSLSFLIKLKKNENALPQNYDLEFDNQLSKALEVLGKYKEYKKPYKVFKEPK